MLEKVKAALRVRTASFDGEIEGLIAACLADLTQAGIRTTDGDPLIERAVILYAKAHFGYGDVAEAERYQRTYDDHRRNLMLVGGYHAVARRAGPHRSRK